jgi:hypothetical protein
MADDEKKAAATRDERTEKARDAELKRQENVEKAVGKAGADELPDLGGPLMQPGLGR